jgi:predicted RNase H-like nuclease
MNDEVRIPLGKTTPEGQLARQAALIRAVFPESFIMGMGAPVRVGRDDFLDACAAAWTARRIAEQRAGRFPGSPDLDRRGLDQAIWF